MKLHRRACPICGSTDDSLTVVEAAFDEQSLDEFAFASRKFPELMRFRMVRCPRCDLMYASPAPDPDWLREGYTKAAFDAGEESRYAARTYARLLGGITPRLSDRRGALDIGTGDGAFLEELLENGFEDVVGIEPSRRPVAEATPRVRPLIRQAFFDPGDFTAESFSLLTCFQTLEHVMEPGTLSTAAYRLLKPGGAFYVVGHNYRSVSALLLGTRSPIFDIEHLQLNSSRSLRHMFEMSGFKDIIVRPILNTYPLFYWVKLLPLAKSFKKTLVTVLRRSSPGRHLMVPLWAGNLMGVGYKAP